LIASSFQCSGYETLLIQFLETLLHQHSRTINYNDDGDQKDEIAFAESAKQAFFKLEQLMVAMRVSDDSTIRISVWMLLREPMKS
jgi:hypothetical protein